MGRTIARCAPDIVDVNQASSDSAKFPTFAADQTGGESGRR
jgi:hypothetical protein